MKETRVRKIINTGASLGVSIPKDVLKSLNLVKGEEIKITIEKVKEVK